MRRNSLLILMSMIVLSIVIGVLLFSIFLQPSASDMEATVIPATLPASPDQQIALSSEVVGMPIRFVYIVSILVVFVSAMLILFGMLLKTLIKDTQ
jgi:hypothetical protein